MLLRSRSLLLLILLSTIATRSSAQDKMWRVINGSRSVGEEITAAGFHRLDGDTLAVVGTVSGKLWMKRADYYTPASLHDLGANVRITSIFDYPWQQGDTAMVIATTEGIFISLDDASTFNKLASNLPVLSVNQLLALNQSTPERYVFAATPQGIARSTDLTTWQMVDGVTRGKNIVQLTNYADRFVAVTADGKLFRSLDGAAIWSETSDGLPTNAKVSSHAFHQVDGTGSMILTDSGLYYSDNSGNSWGKATQPGIWSDDTVLLGLSGFDRTVILLTQHSRYDLLPYETKWYQGSNTDRIKSVYKFSQKSESILIGDTSATWGITPIAPTTYPQSDINIRPDGRIYSFGLTLMSSEPPYDRWLSHGGKIIDPYGAESSIAVSATGEIVVSRQEWNTILLSKDSGRNWSVSMNWKDIPYPFGDIDAAPDGSFWLATTSLYKLSQGSSEWWPMLDGTTEGSPSLPTFTSYPEMYTVLNNGVLKQEYIYRSTNGGNDWTATLADLPPIIAPLKLDRAGYLYARTRNAEANAYDDLYRSVNKGATWSKVTPPHVEFSTNSMQNFVLGPNGVMVVLTQQGRFYRSLDNGTTWSQLSEFSQHQFGDLSMDSLGYLYGRDNFGLNRSTISVLGTSDARQDLVTASAITVFPNPAKGSVTLNFDEAIINGVTISLVDIIGRTTELGTYATSSKRLSLPLSGIPAGVYTLIVSDQTQIYRSRLVVE